MRIHVRDLKTNKELIRNVMHPLEKWFPGSAASDSSHFNINYSREYGSAS